MAETAEFKTLRENIVAIRNCISDPDVLRFAGELFQDGLISDAGHDTAIAVTGTPPGTVVARLVSEAMNKAGNSPDHFYKLVCILESRDRNLASILRKDHRRSKVETSSDYPTSLAAQVTATQNLGPPSKPYATNVTHSSLMLSWGKPQYGADSVQSYTISYRAEDDPPGRWVTQPSQSQLDHVELTHLAADTVYYFKVRAECTAGASGPDSESSNPIKTKRLPFAKKIIPLCKPLSADTDRMKIYQLPTRETMRKKGIVKVAVEQSQNFAAASHKVLMLVGATGAGKSTLINAMANYIMGVDWEDEYRFKLISEETAHDQTKSQTNCITAYTFHKQEGSPLPYTLTVINTPGFANTQGLQRDKQIVTQIKEFFSLRGDEGIHQLHGIGFVTQAPLARLTPTQRYVFDSILSVFGKDVADNIFLMVTFADGRQPPVLNAVQTAGVPFKSHFKFNNSALFATNKTGGEIDCIYFWEMGEKSYKDFFDQFASAKSANLELTSEVLQAREQLEVSVQGLQSLIQAGLNKIEQLRLNPMLKTKELQKEINQTVFQEIDQMKRILRRLQQIALKPNYLTELEYIDLLIESEKLEARPGWRERVSALQEVRKQAEILSIVAQQKQGINPFFSID